MEVHAQQTSIITCTTEWHILYHYFFREITARRLWLNLQPKGSILADLFEGLDSNKNRHMSGMQHPSWTFEKVIDNYCKTPAAGNLYLSSSELLEWLKETANLAKTCIDAYRLPCIPFVVVVVAFLDAQKFQTLLFKPRIWESPQYNLRDDLQFFSIEHIETIMEVVRRYFAVSVLAAIFHFCDGFKKMFP